MIKRGLQILSWFVLALLMYGAADILEKGHVLNSITPFPVFGYVLWALIILLFWRLIVKPILDFLRLSRRSKCSARDRAEVLRDRLRAHIKRCKNAPSAFPKEGWCAYDKLDAAIKRKQWETIEPLIQDCLPYDTLHEQGRSIVLSHSRTAALAVAFSRNSFLDGICMLVIQMKLVIALARIYGYKPSPVFNICCFIWIATNSIAAVLLRTAAAGIAEGVTTGIGEQISGETVSDNAVEDGFGDALGEVAVGGAEDGFLIGAEAVGQRIATFTISILMEAVLAGSAVYVTGQIFRSKLNGEWERPTFGSLIKLRREGRRELGKCIPEMAKGLLSRAGSVGKDMVASAYDSLHKIIFEQHESSGRNAGTCG